MEQLRCYSPTTTASAAVQDLKVCIRDSFDEKIILSFCLVLFSPANNDYNLMLCAFFFHALLLFENDREKNIR